MGRTGTVGRRALLAAGAGVMASAGCTSGTGGGPREPSAADLAARAEAALRRRSAAASASLLARYDAVLAAHPPLGTRLAPLRASVAAHTKALAEGGTGDPAASAPPGDGTTAAADGPRGPAASPGAAAPSGSSGVRPSAPATARPVPADPAAALRELASAVRTTADAHTAALLDAPPEYARLLASVAAAGAAHAYLLTEGARG
ncbi:hypothetical protein [Streptomyces sp. NPDC053755]|uniref:hypothetical protein n=1 Tax=Streptomyces sp. NPDC053755 TaxID=3155815 RepID=UPI0034397580